MAWSISVWKGPPEAWAASSGSSQAWLSASILRGPLPLCPVAINRDISVYFGYRKCGVEVLAATLFLDLPRLTFELSCSQSSSIYQMGETLGQLYKLLFAFFGSATAPIAVTIGEKTKLFHKFHGEESISHWKARNGQDSVFAITNKTLVMKNNL
uniref:Uncharacterized protein n=1 Tax=Homo sapiens TaxID=9606 RepID=Q14569_HUMAN|nr:unknown [Homo sapiens]